jgi:hypothetical protein
MLKRKRKKVLVIAVIIRIHQNGLQANGCSIVRI